MTSPGLRGREYILAIVSLGGEYVAVRYSMGWLGWLAAFFLWLAFLTYTKDHFQEIKWQRYGTRVCSAALIAFITFHLTRPRELQSVILYYGNAELNGQTIDATYMPEKEERSAPGRFVLKDIRAEQIGRYPTRKVTLVWYFSDNVFCEPGDYACRPIAGDEGFSAGFQWGGLSPINPKEPWPVPVF